MAVISQNESAYTLSWNKDKASSKKEMYENVNNSVMVPVGVSRMKRSSFVIVEKKSWAALYWLQTSGAHAYKSRCETETH